MGEVSVKIDKWHDQSLLINKLFKDRITHVLVKVQQACFVIWLFVIYVEGAVKEGEEVLETIAVFCFL